MPVLDDGKTTHKSLIASLIIVGLVLTIVPIVTSWHAETSIDNSLTVGNYAEYYVWSLVNGTSFHKYYVNFTERSLTVGARVVEHPTINATVCVNSSISSVMIEPPAIYQNPFFIFPEKNNSIKLDTYNYFLRVVWSGLGSASMHYVPPTLLFLSSANLTNGYYNDTIHYSGIRNGFLFSTQVTRSNSDYAYAYFDWDVTGILMRFYNGGYFYGTEYEFGMSMTDTTFWKWKTTVQWSQFLTGLATGVSAIIVNTVAIVSVYRKTKGHKTVKKGKGKSKQKLDE